MITRLIVPLDGSHQARHALPVAIGLAERMGATVELVTAVDPSTDDHQLRDEIDSLVRQSGAPVEIGELLPGDDIAEVITGRRQLQPDSAIVMSSHGPSRVSGVLTDSVASELLAEGEPVLLIGPHVGAHPVDLPVVACVDSSAESQQVIPMAAAWASALRVPLVLLRVLRPYPPEPLSVPGLRREDETLDLRMLAADTAAAWPALDVQCRAAEHPVGVDDALAMYLQRHPTQVIAVATHVRTGLDRLLHPSTTAAVVRHLAAPVLVVPIARAPLTEIEPVPGIEPEAVSGTETVTVMGTKPAAAGVLGDRQVVPGAPTITAAASAQPASAELLPFSTIIVPVEANLTEIDPAMPVAERLAAAAGVTVQPFTSTGETTDVAEAIINAAANEPSSIICMSTGAPGRLIDTVHPTITGRVLRWSPRLVVLVGPNGTVPEFGFSEVIACVDGSLVSEAVAEVAGTWAHRFGLAARILEVIDPADELPDATPVGRRYVQRLAARIERDHGVVAIGTTVEDTDASRAIRTWSEADPAALFVMASHGIGLSERALGGVVFDVIRNVANPVVVLPAHAPGTDTTNLTPASEVVPG